MQSDAKIIISAVEKGVKGVVIVKTKQIFSNRTSGFQAALGDLFRPESPAGMTRNK